MPLMSRFDEPSTGSTHTTYRALSQRSSRCSGSAISSEITVQTRPESVRASTMTSLDQVSSLLTVSPWTLISPVVPSWPIRAAWPSSTAIRCPAPAMWDTTDSRDRASSPVRARRCCSSVTRMPASAVRVDGTPRIAAEADRSEAARSALRGVFGFGPELRRRCLLAVEPRIVARERLDDLRDRDVRHRAAIVHVFHVTAAGDVVGVEQRVSGAIELERAHAELVAQRAIEHRRGLDPPAVEEQFHVAVEE